MQFQAKVSYLVESVKYLRKMGPVKDKMLFLILSFLSSNNTRKTRKPNNQHHKSTTVAPQQTL